MEAVIRTGRCPLYAGPSEDTELVDEVLLGWQVDCLETKGGWTYVRTDYRYEGWLPTFALTSAGGEWQGGEKTVLRGSFCDILTEPRYQAPRLLTACRGGLVMPLADRAEGWRRIALPDGRTGWLREERVAEKAPLPLPQAVCRAALGYLGTPYRWGGKTPAGIDCSGLAFMAYRLCGVTIFRDAALREGFPIRAVKGPPGPGDLLYYPGHVAVCLGNGRYVHATGKVGSAGVVVNSLRPGDPDYRADLSEGRLTAIGRYSAAGE